MFWLLNKMLNVSVNGRKPLPEVFISYFNYCKQQQNFFDEVSTLFNFCQTNDVKFNEEVAKHFIEICPVKEKIKFTEILKR